MGSKRKKMLAIWILPGIMAIIRVTVTMVYLIWNPLAMPLRFFQLINIGVYIGTSFSYYKLYRDGVPVISVITPLLLHGILVFLFKRVIAWQSIVPLFVLDVLFLITKGIKSSLFPYDIEGEDDDEEMFDMDELIDEAE